MKMGNLIRVSSTEREVLELLKSGRKMYGLEMVKASELLQRGSVYVYLSRMVKKGFLTDSVEEVEGQAGMPRRKYQISGLGLQVLHTVEAFEGYSGSPQGVPT